MEKFDYEKSIKRLENIAAALEKGELTLDETVKLYEEGTKLAAMCSDALDKAELKITDLSVKKETADD